MDSVTVTLTGHLQKFMLMASFSFHLEPRRCMHHRVLLSSSYTTRSPCLSKKSTLEQPAQLYRPLEHRDHGSRRVHGPGPCHLDLLG
jgi:hypothetical protein